MRSFHELDEIRVDDESGVLFLTSSKGTDDYPRLSMRREGGYLSISVSYGPMEMALRPRFPELVRVLGRLHPVSGLQTTRQVGTAQAYVALGLDDNGALILRPTIVADATGLMCYNLLVKSDVRETLFSWLDVTPLHED